ncbi:MAG: hypothetical protein II336_18155 [Loktanella sp.]|nr:hypothetical protein [Loktanella sp.]
MDQPIRPVGPPPALRSQPETFSPNFEAFLLYVLNAHPEFVDLSNDFQVLQNQQALAAAVAAAAGNLSPAQRAAFAGGVVGIATGGDNPLEPVDIVEYDVSAFTESLLALVGNTEWRNALGGTTIGNAVFTAVDAAAARITLGVPISGNPNFTLDTGSLATRDTVRTFVDSSILAGVIPVIAAQRVGQTGTSALLKFATLTNASTGQLVAGSDLQYSNAVGANLGAVGVGVWELRGATTNASAPASTAVFERIS